ncbi:hypothetical protein [Enhydrobacter sp.]|uniref:hypothetical protein n=1 Tax=Enhydrobacter sp. TaxID=1894999 RepID=UPI00260AD047|nr:hypothetical protein [Enhydrobacter sp.]WIM10650.1 MAG: hypothetical protein OJF58_001606 [Enhydrobacter sp.]
MQIKKSIVPLVALVLMQPAATRAQGDDAAYCAALSALASRYIVGGTAEGRGVPNLDTSTAISDCASGNTAAGIPVLEQKLRANGFSLPKRS